MKNRYILFSVPLASTLRLWGIVLALGWFLPSLTAQTVSLTDQLGDLSSRDWKKNPDIGNVFISELNKADIALAQPNLQPADKSMYLAYKRIVQEVQANKGGTVHESLIVSYKQLMQDYLKDADLKDLPLDGLSVLLQGLVETLTATPVMEVQRF